MIVLASSNNTGTMIALVGGKNSGLAIKSQCWEIQINDDDNSSLLSFMEGRMIEDGIQNRECNSMNRANCKCCEQAIIDCGENALKFNQCQQELERNDLLQGLALHLTEQIARNYVYV
jgi:hypothetical protein